MRHHFLAYSTVQRFMALPKLLLLLSFTLFSTKIFAAPLPDWLTTPPSDSPRWFYTIGQGETRQQAQQAALADLAARIQTEVATTTQQFVVAQDQQVQYFLEQENRFNSEDMTFNRLEVVAEHQQSNGVFVLLKVDHDGFFTALSSQLMQQLNLLRVNSTSNTSISKQVSYPKAEEVTAMLNYHWQKPSLQRQMNILRAYDVNIDQHKQLQTTIEQAAKRTSGQLNLKLQLPPTLAPKLQQQLTQWANNAGLNINPQATENTLQLLVTTPNIWLGHDQFNYVNKIEFDLVALFQQTLIANKRFSAQSFAAEPQLAQQQTIEQLVQQLNE